MSTLYTCEGKDCPLKDNPTGLAIIPFKAPRWTLTMKPEISTDDMRVTAVHLCEVCRDRIRAMVES